MRGKAGGFYTEEIRERGVRRGFRLVTLDGQDATLSHTDIDSPYRVGVSALRRAARQGDLVVINEIGKMELLSTKFREAVLQIIEGGHRVLGTITLSPDPLVDAIKRHPRVNLVTVTEANRHQLLEEISGWLETEQES
jgi:nucleoside-triphosphatase